VDNPGLSRGEIIRAIRSGSVMIDEKAVMKPGTRVREGEAISAMLGDIPPETLKPDTLMDIPVLYENENFCVIDKPAGIQAHPSAHEKDHTIANWIISKYPMIADVGEDPMRPGIVHRLDKDTSGILVFAKNQKTFIELRKLFATRKVKKTYLALAIGPFNEDTGIIEEPIARSRSYRRQTVVHNGHFKGTPRESVTRYRIISRHDGFALVEARPETGRMHQIRVHLASIGHPIVGDRLYAPKKRRAMPSADRQMLHAHMIEFDLFAERFSFRSAMPDDMAKLLES
jgi:23S rRNA pseudouridine1911/1915/1917 synthase